MSRYIYGVHPALEMLQAVPDQVEQVFLQQGPLKGPLAQVAQLAEQSRLPVKFVARDQLERMANGGVHQGVMLRAAEFAYADVEQIIAAATAPGEQALVLVLDGIEDPHNLGALIRSGLALGAHGVIIPQDRAVGITAAVTKTSAGALAKMPVARVTNISRCVVELKDAGLWVSAADHHGDRLPESVDFVGPTALIVGNEGHGIRRNVLEKSDFRVRIPLAGQLASLNASVAGAILMYEVARQRRRTT